MSGDSDNSSTCLSTSQHGPGQVHDFMTHYFGCIEISERKNFLSETKNERFWNHFVEIEVRKLKQQGNTDGRDLQVKARNRVAKKRLSLANEIEGIYKRTDTLRNALKLVECKHKRPDIQTFNGILGEQDCNLVENASRSHRLWKNDQGFVIGIQRVRDWKESKRKCAQNHDSNHAFDQEEPDAIDSDANDTDTEESMLASDGRLRPNPNRPYMYMDSGRRAVRNVITTLGEKGKDAFAEYEHELPTYDLERDVNGYIIQWDILHDQNCHPPQLEHQSSHGSVMPKESTLAPERFLRGHEEDSFDFQGHFPDQKISLSFLLGENSKGAEHGIMSKDHSNDRVRYFHIPYNNMKWVENAIARYFNENPSKDEDLCPKDGLTTRSQMVLRPEYWRGQQHGGKRTVIHARHMRAICERISSNVWESEDNPENFVLFMPFLHWEEDRKRDKIARIIEEQSEKHQKQREEAEKEAKQARIRDRTYMYNGPDDSRGHEQLKLHSLNLPPSHEVTSKKQIDWIRKDWENRASSKADATPKRTFTELAGGRVSMGDVKDERDETGLTLLRIVRLRNDHHGRLRSRNKLGQFLLDAARLYEAMSIYRDQQVLEKYLYHDPPLHPRRTLDQSYYGVLKTTKVRDRDQVVCRGTMPDDTNIHKLRRLEKCRKEHFFKARGKTTCSKEAELEPGIDNDTIDQYKWDGHWSRMDHDGCDHCRDEIRKVSRVVMVDQLWMWILDKKTVITSFPNRYGTSMQDASDVHKSIRTRVKNARKNQIRSVFDVALIILDECSHTFFDRTKTLGRQPEVMGIFAEWIGALMNKQSVSFQHMWHWTQRAAMIYNSKAKWGVREASQFDSAMLTISPEGKLQREVKHIIDELDIMIMVSNEQKEVITRFTKHVENMYDPTGNWKDDSIRKADHEASSNASKLEEAQEKKETEEAKMREKDEFHWFRKQAYKLILDVSDCITELQGLRKSAESTSEHIKDLIDLKLQQAGILQAWQSVKQADESVRQGRSIMVFTLVTIIFLPLSFMSSVFGMNNSNIGDNQMSFHEQANYMSVIAVSIMFASCSFPRTILWCAYKLAETWLLVHTGIYAFWLFLTENFKMLKSDLLLQKLEEQVEEMKVEVRNRRWVKKTGEKEVSSESLETGRNTGVPNNCDAASETGRQDHSTCSGGTQGERVSNANSAQGSDNNV